MRGVCEALLAKAARDVDDATRARLRVQLYSDPDLSARVLAARIRPRKRWSRRPARAGDNAVPWPKTLAETWAWTKRWRRQILDDETGAALAVACKGANLDRAAFSALALMAHPGRDRAHAFAVLDAFDNVPASEATASCAAGVNSRRRRPTQRWIS